MPNGGKTRNLDNLDRLSMKDLQVVIDVLNKKKTKEELRNLSNLQLKIKDEKALLKQELIDIENNYDRNDLLDLE
ncbi:hypothetical protein LCGC14_1804710 [marine sediment metagenome]|uniref:Uncharacterized protein n=1 Tax=marine sediment metagenome TaxID=412755 RepID=A0A0F9HBF5_9ZZZZ